MADEDGCIAAMILSGAFACGGLLAGYWCGAAIEQVEWQNDAASRGVAEYYLDENHSIQWRWLVERVEEGGGDSDG